MADTLKGYVRIDGSGRIVPSSLILRKKMPRIGKWVEVSPPQVSRLKK